MMPVIMPPVRNEITRGFRFEKSLDGETTFAATFVFNVATSSAISAIEAISGWCHPGLGSRCSTSLGVHSNRVAAVRDLVIGAVAA